MRKSGRIGQSTRAGRRTPAASSDESAMKRPQSLRNRAITVSADPGPGRRSTPTPTPTPGAGHLMEKSATRSAESNTRYTSCLPAALANSVLVLAYR